MDWEKTAELLIKHEGMKLKAYTCPAGKTTIGVGRNLDDKGISETEALSMLDNDIEECLEDLRDNVFPDSWFHMSDTRQAALVDMRFNLGPGGFRGFGKMISAVKAASWEMAADEMLDSRWARQVSNRAEELAQMMRAGK